MRIFITGGCKTGKSTLAQILALKKRPACRPLYYLASMIPSDDEDKARIARHRCEREGLGFETIEVHRNILTALDKCEKSGFILFDSVTALLANEMFEAAGVIQPDAYKKIIYELDKLLAETNNIVIVSDYIHSDAFIFGSPTELYRFGLACIHKHLAKICDAVIESCYGNFIIHKGRSDLILNHEYF